MKKAVYLFIICLSGICFTACSPRFSSTANQASKYVTHERVESYNELTMDLDPNGPIEYTIDISTPDGKLKLNKISVAEAQQLALVEAIMHARCVALFHPQYTQLVKRGKVLRVTVYGTPAYYKKKESLSLSKRSD